MHWGNSEILWALALIPVLGWLGWRTLLWRERAARALGDPRVLARLYPASAARWRRRRLLLLLFGATMLMLAAARPQYGKIEQSFKTFGTSAMVALDCSPSMGARDVSPTRMDDAKECLRFFLRKMRGNQVGIIAFAGTAFLQCPMTVDTDLASTILDSIGLDSIGMAGTDIGKAIEVAMTAFQNAGDDMSGRTLLLITDGEDNEGRGVDIARKAAAMHIRIYAIGIGTERGSVLEKFVDVPGAAPGSPDARQSAGFMENSKGTKVNSRLQMGTLDQIAQITGGKAYDAGNNAASAVQSIVDDIYRQQKVELESRKQVIYQDRFQWFLFPALLALMLSTALMPERTRAIGPAPAGDAKGRIGKATT